MGETAEERVRRVIDGEPLYHVYPAYNRHRDDLSALLARVERLEGALEDEREACAKLAESHTLGEEIIRAGMVAEVNHVKLYAIVSRTIAKAIRERALSPNPEGRS